MDSAENDLAALVRAEVERQSNPYQIMTVSSVREDGKVNLQWGEAIINDVAANQAYNPRAEGDVVLVLNHSAGWRVIDKIGGPVEIEIPEPVDLTFGDGLPAGDFVQVNSIFMKDGAIYGLIGEGPAPGPGEPPRKSKPKPVTLDPSSRAAYRSGSRDGSRVAQGSWSSYPKPWSGLWLFGSRIEAACNGKTVDRMQVRVARTAQYHGVSGKVRPRLGLHNETSAPSKTPKLTSRWDGPGLGMGDSKWITLPASQAARLASGASRGIGIGTGNGNSNYMIATEGCGNLKITFKA